MTTIRLKFRPSTVEGRPGTIYYQVCRHQAVRRINTRIHIHPQQWDPDAGRVLTGHGGDAELRNLGHIIEQDMRRLRETVERMDASGKDYTIDEVVAAYKNCRDAVYSLEYMERETDRIFQEGRLGTARNRRRAMNSFAAFLSGKDIPLCWWSRKLINDYAGWLAGRSLARNTVSFYMRILRSVYNQAVKEGLVQQDNPFTDVYTGVDRTRKRAVGEDVVLRMMELDLSGTPGLDLARDMFIFSYCTRGMAFVDMVLLRRCDIHGESIVYSRKKTGQKLTVHIEPCTARIIKKYAGTVIGSPYIFPVIRSCESVEIFRQYQTALGYYNRKLKRLSRRLGLETPLSSYVARHTWATTARNRNTPLSVISSGMGHTSEKTTRIYLAALDESIIDRANSRILAPLNLISPAPGTGRRKKITRDTNI